MTPRPSLEQLYAAYAGDVRRFAYWLTRDAAQADDITSETFVRAVIRFESIRTESVKGYLLAVARRLAQAESRRRRRLRPIEDDHRDLGSDLAAQAEERSEMAAVLSAVDELPQGEREALVLRAVEELPYEEIARVLGISVVAAKVRVHRARVRLIARTGRGQGENA